MEQQRRPRLKTSLKAERTYAPISNGRSIGLTSTGDLLASILNGRVLLSDCRSGQRKRFIRTDGSEAVALAVSPPSASAPAAAAASGEERQQGVLCVALRSLALNFYALPSGQVLRSVPRAHSAPVTVIKADSTGSLLATGAADGSVKVWDAVQGHCTHVFASAHGAVVSALAFDTAHAGRARLASAGADCAIKVFDLHASSAASASTSTTAAPGVPARPIVNLANASDSVPRGLAFSPSGDELVSGSRDRLVRVHDISDAVATAQEKSKKAKKAAKGGASTLLRSVDTRETLEACGLVQDGKQLLIYTAGDKGALRLWDLDTLKLVKAAGRSVGDATASDADEEDDEEEEEYGSEAHHILHVEHTPGTLTTLDVEQNIVLRAVPSLETKQQVVGFNDEVIDSVFLHGTSPTSEETEGQLAIATNSELVRVYNLASESLTTDLLRGHTDVVLALARSPDGQTLVSASKDSTARVWRQHHTKGWRCVAVCAGHVEAVGAVAVSKKTDEDAQPRFIITASQDHTAKVWDLGEFLDSFDDDDDASSDDDDEEENVPVKLRCMATLKVHEKDINAVDIAPNDKLLVTASQDRTARLFAIAYKPPLPRGKGRPDDPPACTLAPVATLKGHKRGVWAARFSPVDKCLATASGDRTVKLWSLNDFACIKTFEGHTNSVLRVEFVTRGMQLLTCASDGLVKLWNIRDEQCVATLDNHEEKIWALAVSSDESTVVSGGADSLITMWRDVTEEVAEEKVSAMAEQVRQEQDFTNYVAAKDYTHAIMLSLTMSQPRRLYNLLHGLRGNAEPGSFTGSRAVDSVVAGLSLENLRQLILFARDWNTSARTSDVAQRTINTILRTHSVDAILEALGGGQRAEGLQAIRAEQDDDDEAELQGLLAVNSAKHSRPPPLKDITADVLDALIPYTERHFARSDKLVRESYIVEHLLALGDDLLGDADEMVVDGDSDSEDSDAERIGR